MKTYFVSQRPTNPIAAYTLARQAALQVLSASIERGMEPHVILRAVTTRPRLLPDPLFERLQRRVFRTGNTDDLQSQAHLQETGASH